MTLTNKLDIGSIDEVRDWHLAEWSFNEARGTPWDGKLHKLAAEVIDARIAELTAEVAQYQIDSEYMQWIADNAEIVTTGQGMRVVLVLNVFGNNNWSIRDYLSMEINGTMHAIARNALKEG